MTKLSFASQAVKDAVLALYPDKATQDIGWPLDIPTIAAALRAAADQVMPEEPRPTGMRPCGDTYSAREIRRAERMKLRDELLAIATELENANV
jgi:hypothetical protein